jgi:hypothetical protein
MINEEKKVFSYLLMAGAFISAMSVYFTQAEDMGIFLTVSGFVAKGYKLYVETFEIKDPIFFYSASGMMKLFGLRGAFLIDIFLISISPILSYLALRNLDFKKQVSFVSSILFTLALCGTYYEPFRTQILGIILFITAVSISGKKNFYVGILLAMILFTKLNMVVFYPVVILIICLKDQKWPKELFKVGLGFLLFSLMFIGLMQTRGEFGPYLKMVYSNLNYARIYQSVVGLPEGLIGHFKIWNSTNQSLTYFAISLISLTIALKSANWKSLSKLQISSVISINCTSVLFLGLTGLWIHHLQILSISTLINFAVILQFLFSELNQNHNETNLKKRTLRIKQQKEDAQIKLLFLVVALLSTVNYAGMQIPTKPQMNLNQWIKPSWIVPPEIKALESIQDKGNSKISISRLGMNDDLGYGAFLDAKKFEYKCGRNYIVGFEDKEVLNSFLSCINKEVEILTIGPMFENIVRSSGNYNWFKSEANRLLNESFVCTQTENIDYRICFRKPFVL